jgi:UDP-2,3-diacylglucosamine hydrolase
MRRLFLSDVHLSPRLPDRAARLLEFLEREAARADELYILGDLFDYWIGPKHLDLPDYRDALAALRRTTGRGVRVLFILGNRDFYMRRRFEDETGIRVAPGRTSHRMEVASRKVCLCHGDYLEGRRDLGFWIQELIRSRPMEAFYTRLPAGLQKAGAEFYRRVSGARPRRPSDLEDAAVLAEFRRGTDIIVCGHVHRAQEIRSSVDGREAVLFTLPDWSDGASYLVEEGGRWEFIPGAAGNP